MNSRWIWGLALGFLCLLFSAATLRAQCSDCGNGAVDAGETSANCPQDQPHAATCLSPCSQPAPFETNAGIRQAFDFVGTTTYSSSGLPAGWIFASGPTSSTASTLAAAGTDAYGAKAGLVQPNCSASCTSTNGFCIGNLASSQAVGSGGSGGKLGANFDGRANINANLSYAVLRGQSNPTLVSPTFNMSGVNSFKIQFWAFPSESSCGQSNSWGSCTGNAAFVDFSSDNGVSWTQVITMNISSTNSDMCTSNSTNTLWLRESAWARVCLTVFENSSAAANFYPSATATTAASGVFMNPAFFTANFKFRVRYSQTVSCTSGISTTNPGRYLALDYPVITSGNEMIPCGLSFINMCGYGADNNDDGVGSTLTSTTAAFGTVRRGVNHAERGVEIFTSQSASYGMQNLSGSTFTTNFDLCNAEGGDRQCIDWRSNNNLYTVVYEMLSDMEAPTAFPPSVQYYEGSTAQSVNMTKVTSAGRIPTVGWRYQAFRTVMCGNGGGSDLNPGCNGYSFMAQTPTQMARGFYHLAINSTGQAWTFYGATSCSHYFNGPFVAPIAVPDTVAGSGNYVFCTGSNQLVFTGLSRFCSDPSGFSGSGSIVVTGPNGFNETITSGGQGVTPIVDAGTYVVTAQTPTSPAQCVNCSRRVCITVTAADITDCSNPLAYSGLSFWGNLNAEGQPGLQWRLMGDAGCTGFVVERRLPGQDFVALVELAHVQEEYSWVDADAAHGLNEYRLRLLHEDGRVAYSELVSVNVPESKAITLLPNPGRNEVEVRLGFAADGFTLELMDMAGRKLQAWDLAGASARVRMDGLPVGMYMLRVVAGGKSYSAKWIKE